jgi:hypothetical protein
MLGKGAEVVGDGEKLLIDRLIDFMTLFDSLSVLKKTKQKITLLFYVKKLEIELLIQLDEMPQGLHEKFCSQVLKASFEILGIEPTIYSGF